MLKQLTTILLAATTALGAAGARADEHGHAHHAFAKDVDAFHAQFAPIWHAQPGEQRSRNACAKADETGRLARAIKSADSRQLVATIDVLKSKCPGKPADLDAALSDVHEAFHALIDAKASPR